MSNLTALLVTSQMGTGGAPRVVLDICKHLRTEVNKIEVAFLGGKDGLVSEFEDMGIHVTQLGKSPLSLSNIFNLKALIESIEPDIVNTHMSVANQIGRICSVITDIPVISTIHMSWDNNTGMMGTVDLFMSPLSIANVMVSNAAAKTFPHIYGIFSDNHVINNCINIEEITKKGRVDIKECEWYHNTITRPIIGNVARFDPKKRRTDAIKAFSQLLDTHPSATLIMTGDSPRREKIKNISKKLGVNDSVVFCGHINNPQTVYAHSDLIVHASISEAFSIAMLESMAHQKPIVATDIPPFREALGENYPLVSPKDPSEIASMMSKIIDNKSFKKELSEVAYTMVKERYSGKTAAENYLRLFKKYSHN